MADNKIKTVFQNLGNALYNGFDKNVEAQQKSIHSYTINDAPVFKTKDKNEYEKEKAQLRQEKYLANQWVSAGLNLSQTTSLVSNNLKLMYRDVDIMDNYPEIGAALDIFSEESCLKSDTYIKLVNGECLTIGELYEKNYKDFWVYAIVENGSEIKVSKIEKVICHGVKPLSKITLDDKTVIECTDNHQWLLSNNNWARTDELKIDDSLMSIEVLDNHKIVNIEQSEPDKVYDLVNSSVNHCFGVKCNTGQIISHNCVANMKGQILNITSNSDRVKKVLEDLFVNRLDIHINLPMWVRTMCKYGNCFVMLNIADKNGVIGARQMPVYEIERIENGIYNPYIAVPTDYNKNRDTEFVWLGQNVGMPFKSWQIAHFRLLTDSLFLPYGCSILHKARRHFRILSMMEDTMLIYRLERSFERRVFKIFVGNIDDADIPAYVQEIANTFKRTPIIDPETGQLDLRKNSLDVSQDIFIPVKDANATNPIDTLPAASNLDKIEDLKYIQNKVLTALRIPKEFLNFDEASGDGKNLAMKDIRFARTVNRIQQALIMELTKIAVIHLYLNGFTDELTNFKITMNNPSTQSNILRLEELSKKVALVTSSVADPGNGIQIMSLTRAQREILGWSDEEITQNMLEIRLEKALAAELLKTEQIIKRTGLFDEIDKIYGEPDAEYSASDMGEEAKPGGAGGPIGGLGGFDESGNESPDLGNENEPNTSESQSNEEAPGSETIEPTSQSNQNLESVQRKIEKLLKENKTILNRVHKDRKDKYLNAYLGYIKNSKNPITEKKDEIVPIYDEAFIKNQETNDMLELLDKNIKDDNKKII
jgi:hypothetical protein